MKTSTCTTRSLFVLAISLWATPAIAQLWDPLDTVPKPNAIIGHDVSVTMGIEADCSACHSPGDPRTRLDLSKQQLLQTLPLFKDYFVFGGFQYSGCYYAKINPGSRIMPTPANPDSSYQAVVNEISSAEHCRKREDAFPNGGQSSGCLTPTPNCIGDFAVIQQLMLGQLRGFDPALPWENWGCVDPALDNWCTVCDPAQVEGGPCMWYGPDAGPKPPVDWAFVATQIPDDPGLVNLSTCLQGWCENPVVFCDAGGSYQVQAALLDKLSRMQWPRWYDGDIDPQRVRQELCDPIQQIYTEVSNEMRACSLSDDILPPNLSGAWCTPGLIKNNACTPGSPFFGTCVCDNSNANCQSGGRPTSDCGTPLTWKARQQIAVCETYDTSAPDRFGSFFRNQSDNTVNPGGCRENVSMFFTDGYMGGTPGTAGEALQALPTYTSFGGLSNMFVFRVSNVFAGDADAMMGAVTRGAVNNAYLATDLTTMQVSFARVLNRVYKGVYNGSSLGADTFGSRVAIHAFTVPGYNLGGPIGDDYLGWPARIAWHSVNAAGNVDPNPIFETDWSSKANANSSCGPSRTLAGSLGGVQGAIGPDGAFRNGIARDAVIPANQFDRNGDGIADNHPSLQFGKMFSIASTKPLVVEAPRESPEGTTAADLLAFMAAARTRPRMIYVMSNGYLHGFDGGAYSAGGGTFGYQKLAFGYDDTTGSAGTEVFRYAPPWIDDARPANSYDWNINNLVQQPMMTGQLSVSDVRVRISGVDQFRSVLVGAQGKNGRGVFAVDVTDPCQANVLSSWTLPGNGDKASNEPQIYMVRMPNAPEQRAAVIMTGGLGGSPSIYAHDVATGNLLFSAALPAGGSYPTAPICADTTGEGRITHCYVVREDGLLVRAEVRFDGRFGDIADITPAGVGGGGAVFSTAPAVFFGPDGSPNIVFASGDWDNLTRPSGQDYLYKIIDGATRRRGIPNNVRGNIASACGTGTNPRSGKIALSPGDRVISPPLVEKGVIAVSAYSAQSSGCAAGSGNLYAIKYDSCNDLVTNNPNPTPRPTGDGIPSAPVLLRGSEKLLVATSEKPTGAQTVNLNATTRGGKTPVVKRLYWRPEGDVR